MIFIKGMSESQKVAITYLNGEKLAWWQSLTDIWLIILRIYYACQPKYPSNLALPLESGLSWIQSSVHSTVLVYICGHYEYIYRAWDLRTSCWLKPKAAISPIPVIHQIWWACVYMHDWLHLSFSLYLKLLKCSNMQFNSNSCAYSTILCLNNNSQSLLVCMCLFYGVNVWNIHTEVLGERL